MLSGLSDKSDMQDTNSRVGEASFSLRFMSLIWSPCVATGLRSLHVLWLRIRKHEHIVTSRKFTYE